MNLSLKEGFTSEKSSDMTRVGLEQTAGQPEMLTKEQTEEADGE